MGSVIQGLSQIVGTLEQPGSIDTALQRATELAIDVLGADHASLRVCESGSRLRSRVRAGVGVDSPPSEFLKGQGLLGWAVQTRQLVRVPDCPKDLRFHPTPGRGFHVRSVMSVPLLHGKRVLGVFSVSAAERARFGEDDEHVGIVLAHCLARALHTTELERLATTDALTHTSNRSRLLPTLNAEMSRSSRSREPLCVLLMDLDHFKQVNDNYGHAVGDATLCAFTDVVRSCVRKLDVLIRRGGEEFLLVMPATSEAEGLRVAERIRERLACTPLELRPDLILRQTVSIGLATWDGQEAAEALDQRADLAMYEAKRHGRDRIHVAAMPMRGAAR